MMSGRDPCQAPAEFQGLFHDQIMVSNLTDKKVRNWKLSLRRVKRSLFARKQ